MKIYEIDKKMEELIDPETGELKDYEAFEALAMEREEKIDNMIRWIKDLNALCEGLKAERDALSERMEKAKRKAEGLKNYLALVLGGEKYLSPAGEVSYRRSSSVEVDDEFIEWARVNRPDLVTVKENVAANKTAIKDAFKDGDEPPHARIEEKKNLILK